MTSTRIRDSLGRPIRGIPQGGLVYGLVELLSAFDVLHLTTRQYGPVLIAGTAVVSWIQVRLEDRLGWAWLRATPRRSVRRRRAGVRRARRKCGETPT